MMCVRQTKTTKDDQRGMSLVELMVAMVISMVILGGIYQVFTGSTTSYRENEQFARLQENARFTMEILGRELRMAGYTGCAKISAADVTNTLNNPTDYAYNLSVGVEGFDWVGAIDGNTVAVTDFSPNFGNLTTDWDLDQTLTPLVEGSDILTVRGVGSDSIFLEQIMGYSAGTPMGVNSAALDVADTEVSQISQGDILLLADCIGAAVLQVTSLTASGSSNVVHAGGAIPGITPGNSTDDLGHPFVAGAELQRIRTYSYVLANNPAGIPSLYRTDIDTTVELVQGVERMQIRYGLDDGSNGGTADDRQVDTYTTAAGAAGSWEQVVAVRVALLMQGETDPKAPVDTAIYDLDGDGTAEYDPADERRMRRVFKATFTLRNRV